MGTIDADMRTIIAECGLAYVATVMPNGQPNLSPKGSLAVWDDEHLYFANIASPQTVENLRHNPSVEVNCVDIVKRRGYRFKGTAEVLEDGPVFEAAAKALHDSHGPQYPCHHAVLITVEVTRKVLSPAYVFNAEPPSEEAMSVIWARKLGLDSPSGQVEAYEKVLQGLLNFRTVEELRDVFGRQITQEAADQFAEELDVTRDLGQPDEYALPNAIEKVLVAKAAAGQGASDLEQVFNDPDRHELPSQELTEHVESVWDAPGH